MKRRLLIVLSAIFALVFVVSAATLSINMYEQHRQTKQKSELLAIATGGRTENQARVNKNVVTDSTATPNKDTETQELQEPLAEDEQLANYQKLKELNSDFVGWLKLTDTQIDYPVMQTKLSPNFYIRRDFYKNSNAHGCLYVSEKCELFDNPSSNIVIFGHNMRDGEMFAALSGYGDKSFYENHKQIHFDTLLELATYDVIGYFETDLISDNFRYYDYVEGDEELFNLYISNVKKRALYETEATPVYGRQLLTLSTCHRYNENVRLVLVAQRNK